jgi:hypothetical protein
MRFMHSDATPPAREVVPAQPRRQFRPDGMWVEIDGVFLPELPPEVKTRFDHMDALFGGMTPDEILALLPDMYLDAEGFTRIRRHQIYAVPDLD